MRAVAIVQARLGSTRLPGKVMLPIGGKTMLERVYDRVSEVQGLDQIVIGVPRADERAIRDRLGPAFVPIVFGGPAEPLLRYQALADAARADIIMRITADCPLLDAGVAGDLLAEFRQDLRVAYLSNVRPVRLHPDGCDVEIFTASLLADRAQEARTPEEREHVTLGMPATRVPALAAEGADLRWTVDTAEDLEFVREVYRGLEARHLPVSIGNVLSLTPGDACEHCAAKVPHLTREGTTNWTLHQVSVEDGMRLPGGWRNYPAWARTNADGRIFIACEAWEVARWNGTRRKS